jgi:hypothetical protein
LIETLLSKGNDLIQGLIDGANAKVADLETMIGGLSAVITNAAYDLPGALWDVGYDVVAGMANGIRAAFDMVRGAVADLVDLIPGPVRSLLGVFSPSRVMMEIGGYVAEGMALGIQRGTPQVGIAARGMAAAASTNVQADFSASGGGYGGRGGGGGGFQNYGTYYEADRHWEPQNAMSSYSIARSR